METQFIKLNMTPTGINPCFHVSQYDIGRSLGFMIYNGSEVVDLDSYTCTIEATRSDGVAITASVATDDNVGAFETTATMTNKADKYRAQFVIVDGDSNRIASLPFDMDVVKAAMDENAESIEEDASLYQQYTEAVQGAIAEANADIQAEENARIAAVNAEATARQNADATLQNNIDAEATARANTINAEATARQTADNTLQGNINSEASARATQDGLLQTQIDQIIAPSGEAPSAAEVQNARIGADGVTYDTLGNAIRANDNILKTIINHRNVGNVLSGHFGNTRTVSDITYTVTGEEIIISGTSKTNVDSVFWLNDSTGFLNGDNQFYYVDFDSQDSNVRLLVLEDGSLLNTFVLYSQTWFLAKSGHTYSFQIRVTKGGHTVYQTVHPIVSLVPTNKLISMYDEEKENLLLKYLNVTRTNAGVTYTVGEDEIIISGLATGTSTHNLFNNDYGHFISDGTDYYVGFDSNSPNLYLDILDETNNYALIKSFDSDTTDFSLNIPAGHIFSARIRVLKNATISCVVHPSISKKINSTSAFDAGIMSLKKVNKSIGTSTVISKQQYTNTAFAVKDSFSVIDAFTALINGTDFDSQCALSRIALNTDSSSLMCHDGALVINNDFSKAWAVFVNNDTDTTDNPSSSGAFVVLASVDLPNITNVTNITVADYGDTVGDKTIISGTGVPNLVLDNGILHILFSAKLSDNKWYLLERDYVISTNTFDDITVCSLSINSTEYDFTTESINDHLSILDTTDYFISVNAQITSDGTYYYAGLCVGTKIKNSVIIRSANMTNWEVWLEPQWSNNVRAQYEGACYISDGYLYYALRLNNGETMLLAKIDLSDKNIVFESLIPDCGARACWITITDRLYLFHSIEGRLRFEAVWVNKDTLNGKIAFQGLQEYIYPSAVMATINNVPTCYLLSTASNSEGVVLQAYQPKLNTLTPKNVLNRLARLFNLY